MSQKNDQESNNPATGAPHWTADLGPNDAYIREMYSLYLQDPSLVGETWSAYFSQITPPTPSTNVVHVEARTSPINGANGHSQQNGYTNGSAYSNTASSSSGGISGYYTQPAEDAAVQERVYRMISAFRGRGHFRARINPLTEGVMPLPFVEDVYIDFYHYSDEQLDRTYNCSGLGERDQMKLREIISELERIYCGSIGFEFTHLLNQEERLWLQSRIERRFQNGYRLNRDQKLHRLQKIIEAETFESELHRKFVGHKRFSLQGVETVIPMLDTMLEEAAAEGVKKVIFGMPHRGRLNVLANILGKRLYEIFSEFEDQNINTALGSGDVKYHMGYESTYTDINGRSLDLYLAPNPSHLEFVNPVVEGIARAYQDFDYQRDRRAVLPVLLHGDAAFAGQGVVFETLNMSGVPGYTTGGTVHVIVNNQVGFTTDPEDSRSSTYCTDMAKAVQAPVFHVNCENVESACWTIKTALDFRDRYGRDVVIDLYGYRKYGHNEGDDPSFTQPVVYAEIKNKKKISEIYSESLRAEEVITDEDKQYEQAYKDRFAKAQEAAKEQHPIGDVCAVFGRLRDTIEETGIPLETLEKIANTLVEMPEDFVIHPKLKKILEKRAGTLHQEGAIDWGFAETLAFGSLVLDGVAVRLSGQDCGRGTFSQRHLALNDYEGGPKYFPLESLEANSQGSFEVINSTLSEAGVLGFEFGYSTVREKSLILWEAQFGDFANGAQVIIDQFISGSEAKWAQTAGVVLLLPHGYEGQGPEHSSARLERYLQLCAEGNMHVCYPSNGSQYFHLLRSHGLQDLQRPLVIMTPKSLLRLPEAGCSAEALTSGGFQPIIPEVVSNGRKKKTALFLTGKVYYDLMKHLGANEEALAESSYVVCRVEQLYPFPAAELKELFEEQSIRDAYWVQEEPQNMGSWSFVNEHFESELGLSVSYIGRQASASTATGSAKWHAKEQKEILDGCISAITSGNSKK